DDVRNAKTCVPDQVIVEVTAGHRQRHVIVRYEGLVSYQTRKRFAGHGAILADVHHYVAQGPSATGSRNDHKRPERDGNAVISGSAARGSSDSAANRWRERNGWVRYLGVFGVIKPRGD